jgi:hypothetical protein
MEDGKWKMAIGRWRLPAKAGEGACAPPVSLDAKSETQRAPATAKKAYRFTALHAASKSVLLPSFSVIGTVSRLLGRFFKLPV